MDFRYTDEQLELRDRAAALAHDIMAYEDECEQNRGLSAQSLNETDADRTVIAGHKLAFAFAFADTDQSEPEYQLRCEHPGDLRLSTARTAVVSHRTTEVVRPVGRQAADRGRSRRLRRPADSSAATARSSRM